MIRRFAVETGRMLVMFLAMTIGGLSHAQDVQPCAEIEGYQKLDFRVGDRIVSDSAEKRLRDSIDQFSQAFRKADAEVLATLITHDYTHTNLGSSPIDKTAWLKWVSSQQQKIASGELVIKRYDLEDLRIEMLDGHAAALVTGRVISAGQRDGKWFRSEIRFTQLWTGRAGRWQRRAFQDTAI